MRALFSTLLAILLLQSAAEAAPDLDLRLPDLEDSASRLLSPLEEREFARSVIRQLEAQQVLITDPLVEEYISHLGYRLVASSEAPTSPFTFLVIRDDTINAFATFGGLVVVNSGLLLRTENESELAGVLAHEIAHVTQRHLVRSAESAGQYAITTLAAMIAAILLSQGDGSVAEAAIATSAAANIQLQINFTRANEQEADRVGIRTLAEAGFDPHGMASFFGRLQQATRYYGTEGIPEFLRTHPVTSNRIAEAQERAEGYSLRPPPSGLGFLLTRARVRVLTTPRPQTAVEYFREQLASGQFHDEEVARYGLALALLRQGKGKEALKLAGELSAAHPNNLHFRALRARALRLDGDIEAMLDDYTAALDLFPANRPLTLFAAEDLLTAGRPDAALRVLDGYLDFRPPSARIHRLYARAATDAGRAAVASLHMAEYQLLHDNPSAAMRLLRQALREVGDDDYLRTLIEARIEEVRLRLEPKKREGHKRGGKKRGAGRLHPPP